MQPDLILVPFAQDAPAVNVDAIPVNLSPSDPPQAASWSQGFPTVTMTPLAAGGIPPRGQSFNGVLKDITEHLVYIGGGGQYRWSAEYVAAKGGYSVGDVIQADTGLLSYVSLVDNNTANFNTEPSSIGPNWRVWAGGSVPNATTDQRGAVLLATQSQVNAGSGDAVVTPATLAASTQAQSSTSFNTSGTATAQILSPAPAVTSYATKQRFNVTFNVRSGANPTINISGQGAKSLKQYDSSGAKVAAIFASGQNSDIIYDGTDWILLDQIPNISGLPLGYLSGFSLSNNANTPNTIIDVTAGSARDSTNTVDINLAATLRGILQSSGAWAAGNDQNKLDFGAKAANSTYHEFAIRKTSDGTGDILFSLSATAPTMPSGYSGFRWIGRVRTDASGNIVPFIDYGNGRVDEKTAIAVATITATAGGYDQLIPVPGAGGKPCELIFNVFTLGDGVVTNVINPDSTDQLSQISATTYLGGVVANAGGGSATEAASCQMSVFCNASGQVRLRTYNSSGGNTDARLVLVGRREVR